MATELFPAGAADVLYLVDLSSYVLRAYHAIAPLSSPSGEPTHAVHGTVTMLERLFRERDPILVGVAMDSGRETFRQQIYDQYKSNRPPAPDDLKIQMGRCREIVEALGIPIFKQVGVEADDLIASVVDRAGDAGLRVVIVGADKDLMQLVSPSVLMWDTMRNRVFGPEEVVERFGITSAQLGDYLALTGDSSDNIPGVPTVGPKTAKDLLVAHGSLDGIYRDLDQITRKKLRETLTENEQLARISRRLVELKRDCPVELDRDRLTLGKHRNKTQLEEIYRELGFQRQLTALQREAQSSGTGHPDAPPSGGTAQAAAPVRSAAAPVEIIIDPDTLEQWLTRARKSGEVAIEPHTMSPAQHRGPVIAMAFAFSERNGSEDDGAPAQLRTAYVPLLHRYVGAPAQVPNDRALMLFDQLLTDADVRLIAHDTKRCRVMLEDAGYATPHRFAHDTLLGSYLVDPERNHAVTAVGGEIGIDVSEFDVIAKQGRRRLDLDEIEVEPAASWAARRIEAAALGAAAQAEQLDAIGLQKLLDDTELPLAELLATMERRGVLVDVEHLKSLGAQCEIELSALEKRAHEIAGKEFNVNSPRQLEKLLFDELGLKPLKRTKTSRSTDAATLEALSTEHELPEVILQIRQVAKLKGTYIDALPLLVNPATGRIHGAWEQAVAATGRLSSTDPNLQNIPIRTELGRKIREAFIAPPGHRIVSADYSQIELRVLAHLSEDPRLTEAFQTEQDIHTRTAMEIFEVAHDEVTREMRTKAKAVNFGVIYGQGESGLAKALKIPRQEAGRFIAAYFRRYEGVREFMERTLQSARSGEAVRSLLGRRRLVADIKSGNRARRLAAERIAMNMPIQGSAADILKLAMLSMVEPVTPGTRMVLTVHDELVFEVPEAEVELAVAKIREKMESVIELRVPLVVDVGTGPNWNAAH